MCPGQSLTTQPWRHLLILCLVLSRRILAQKTNLWDWFTCMMVYFSAGSLTAVSCSCTSLSSSQFHSFTFAFLPPHPFLDRSSFFRSVFCLVVMFSSAIFFFNLPRIKFTKSKDRAGKGRRREWANHGEREREKKAEEKSERWGQR